MKQQETDALTVIILLENNEENNSKSFLRQESHCVSVLVLRY